MNQNVFQAILTIVEQTQSHMHFMFMVLGLMWAALALIYLTGGLLLILGITPRQAAGLPGIVCAPLLHVGVNHLFFNSIPFLVLSDFLLIAGIDAYATVTVYITLISGILIWLLARPGNHVGASALITGYWSFLVINIYTQGGIMAYILGIVSVYYFAGIFFGIFPSRQGVSWEGHLFGLVAGVITNYLLPYLPMIIISPYVS